MTFGQKYNLDKVKRKMIFEKTVFYDILYLRGCEKRIVPKKRKTKSLY